jgi:Homeodomain-like domain
VVRHKNDVTRVIHLSDQGLSDYEISRRTGIPRSTVQRWRAGPASSPKGPPAGPTCPRCGSAEHVFSSLPTIDYAYLLGQYLGDGTIYRAGRRSYALRISSDARYPGIIDECCRVIERVAGRRPAVRYHPQKRLANIVLGWKAWPCYFPQHGPGRKHSRHIELVGWQQEIVERAAGAFLRGLIHSDGWRGTNRVLVKGRIYEYPRYQFSNRSEDIKRLFTDYCDLLGVEWRPWGKHHISVARRASVALLDRYIGLKS